MKKGAWGVDYRRIRPARHELGSRWLLVLTRLSDGKLLNSWYSKERPGVAEVRRVLAKSLVTHAQPEAVWCDEYLSKYVAPECEKYGLRCHIRTEKPGGLEWNYDERLNRAIGATPPTPVKARAHWFSKPVWRGWLN